MIKRVELLVHAGAPSSRKDDERYRAQAQAYLAFKRNAVSIPASDYKRYNQIPEDFEWHDPSQDETTILDHDPTVFLDNTQMAYIALDSQLVTSSLVTEFRNMDRSSPGLYHAPLSFGQAVTEDPGSSVSRHVRSLPPLVGSSKKRSHADTDEEQHRSPRLLEHSSGSQEDLRKQGDVSPSDWPSQTSYLKSPVLDRSAKMRQLDNETYQRRRSGKDPLPPYIPPPENERVGVAYAGERPVTSTERADGPSAIRSQESAGGNETTSELPTSYSLSDITSESSRAKARQFVSQRSASDPGPRTESLTPTLRRNAADAKAELANPPNSRHSTDRSGPRSAVDKIVKLVDVSAEVETREPADDQIPVIEFRGKQASARQDNVESQPHEAQRGQHESGRPQLESLHIPRAADVKPLSTSIRPPQPSATVNEYTTHVTDSLRFLAEGSDIKGHFQPVTLAREIRPLERGHWVMDCSSWAAHFQVDFWLFLEKFVGNGNAGWGVWCIRGEEDEQIAGREAKQMALGTVKVFCWGEIVKHVYLLLYVASKSKVRKLGLRWTDAEDKTVVQMRGA